MSTAKILKINGIEYDVGGGETPSLLWVNESPSRSFAAQTITLAEDVSNFDFIGVIFAVGSASAENRKNILPMLMMPVSSAMGARMNVAIYRNYVRNITSVSGTSMTFAEGGYYAAYGTNTMTPGNTYVIPRIVLGFKYGGIISTLAQTEE